MNENTAGERMDDQTPMDAFRINGSASPGDQKVNQADPQRGNKHRRSRFASNKASDPGPTCRRDLAGQLEGCGGEVSAPVRGAA